MRTFPPAVGSVDWIGPSGLPGGRPTHVTSHLHILKQTEIQLIVGSRYHELIESADSVVSPCARPCACDESIHSTSPRTHLCIQSTPKYRCRCTDPASASGSCSRSCPRASRRSVACSE